MNKYFYSILLSTCCLLTLAAQADIENSIDYPLLDRMPNYNIIEYNETEFDVFEFIVGTNKKVSIEGKKFKIRYRHQNHRNSEIQKPSKIQVTRNYANAIKKAGGKILFERPNGEYGHYMYKSSAGLEVWVEVRAFGTVANRYQITVIERTPMKQDIVIDADFIKDKIDIDGKIALYGIQFDVGMDIIKPESEETLTSIAQFLENNPSINCWVVGHTDADGSFELNSDLSLRRAQAVKLYLEQNYNIASERLFAEGVGPLAPISSNTTEEGKALNRRVELVKK